MKRVLIVEDDKVVAAAYKQRFTSAGFLVDIAEDGLEGIRLSAVSKPDAVLLDLLMPRLDGLEVLKYIRAHPEMAQLPVVVFSNSYMTNMIENAWRAGANQCLMKASTTPTQVIDAVNKVLSRGAASPRTVPSEAHWVPPVRPLAQEPSAATAPQLRSPLPANTASVLPPPPPGLARTGTASNPEPDAEFQAQIRQLFLGSAEMRLAAMREGVAACLEAGLVSARAPLMGELLRNVHAFIGNAAVAGCMQVAQLASTYEAFVEELQQQPRFLNPSTLRTLSASLDFISALVQSAGTEDAPADRLPSGLVLDHELGAAQATATALERGGFKINVANDPAHALGLLASMPSDLFVIATDVGGINSAEFGVQMRSLPGHEQTPVIYMTSLTDFETYAGADGLGDDDIIARPFLLIEMTLKGLIAWHRKRIPVRG